MDYDNFGTKLSSKRSPTFLPNRVNGISGKQLVAGTGFASDIEMESNAMFAFKNTFDEAEAIGGLRMGIDQFDNKPKFFIGDPTHFMKWDGTNATINGILYSTEGNIAGWSITTDALTGDKVKLDSTGTITSGDFTGQRVEMSGADNTLAFYDESNNVRGQMIGYDTIFGGLTMLFYGTDNLLIGVPDFLGTSFVGMFFDRANQKIEVTMPDVTFQGNVKILGNLSVDGTIGNP